MPEVDGVARLAIIGGGRMGGAIAAGVLGSMSPSDVVVADPSPATRESLSETYGIDTVSDGAEAVGGADVVIVAVKPQVIDDVLDGLAPAMGDALVVSIAGGVTTARLESHLPARTRVVRVMPNTPALVRSGMSIVSGGAAATEADIVTVTGIFGAMGDVVVLPEEVQDACTAISGCGPAYMALFVDALATAGVAEGLSREVAERLALRTMSGTVDLIEATGQSPAEVIDAVCSPGGSTIAAVNVLEAREVRAAIASAVHAAVLRSRELGR